MPGPRPTPSPGLLREVAARLERRRVIGTRVTVVGPRYLEVSVKARVRALDGVNRPALRARVASALDRFFHPLTGGPDGTGWPFGRDVFRSEVLQVIDETEGVDHVLSLELSAEGCPPTCGNLCLPATWLPAAGPHEIEVV
jgi:predicted phage baseplate assembly protein